MAMASSALPAGTAIRASASRGMAFIFEPPERLTRFTGIAFLMLCSTRPISLMELPISWSIIMAEWPPSSPRTARETASPAKGTSSADFSKSMSSPPAEETIIVPSGPQSMFSRYLASKSEQSRAMAPSRPISSMEVKTHSSAGWR